MTKMHFLLPNTLARKVKIKLLNPETRKLRSKSRKEQIFPSFYTRSEFVKRDQASERASSSTFSSWPPLLLGLRGIVLPKSLIAASPFSDIFFSRSCFPCSSFPPASAIDSPVSGFNGEGGGGRAMSAGQRGF